MKNVALPKPDAYRRNLIKKSESLVRSMRWKAHFIINGENDAPKNNTFGLRSRNSPPQINELKNLEDDLLLGSIRTTVSELGDDRRKQFYAERNATKVSPTVLKTFCEMEGFAKGSSHENWQRIGKRASCLRCSVSLSFVDEEVYHVTSYNDNDVISNDVSVERHSDFELDARLSFISFKILTSSTLNPMSPSQWSHVTWR